MSHPLRTLKKSNGGGMLRQGDRDVRLLTLILLMLILGALASYLLADVLASLCWACGQG